MGIALLLSLTLPLAYSETREVTEDWILDSDYTGSIRINSKSPTFPAINSNGHVIKLDSGGIEVTPGGRAFIVGGTITSSESFLDVKFDTKNNKPSNLHIGSVIANSDHQIGLRITGNDNSGLFLEGGQSNTFTGNAEVSGYATHLILAKTNGAIAVRGDIFVRESAIFRFSGSQQVLKTSNVTLKSNGQLQYLSDKDITNTFRNLSIEDSGVIRFNHEEGQSQNSKYYIKIDNLLINQGGHLHIQGWREGRDFLLVRKDSMHLQDALNKIAIDGWGKNQVYLRDYDADYYSIEAAPEPATFGAILGGLSLSLFIWCRSKQSRRSSVYRRD